jgi:GNAT acetyltransferase-like protein
MWHGRSPASRISRTRWGSSSPIPTPDGGWATSPCNGTRAVQLRSRWAFAEFAIVELRLEARVDNLASRRVAEKAGFVRDEPHDRVREVKGGVWEMAAYSLDRRADTAHR